MGCNCKATDYVRKAKKYYGYESETRQNIPSSEKMKMAIKAIFMWVILILAFPLVLIYFIFIKMFTKSKSVKLFNTIRIRI